MRQVIKIWIHKQRRTDLDGTRLCSSDDCLSRDAVTQTLSLRGTISVNFFREAVRSSPTVNGLTSRIDTTDG